jgi:uncharacterized membrane protein HdeD (DUF308 family)
MHWTRLEQAIVAKLIRYPLSTTPRERALVLLTVRSALLGASSIVLGMLLAAIGALAGWNLLATTGVVLIVAGLFLLVSAMVLDACLIIVYGD